LHNICFPEAPRFNFGWKVIEGADPFVIQTYEADWDDLTRYRNETVEALKVFAESVREGRFAGDRDDTQRITE
jgi:hypothetical protein